MEKLVVVQEKPKFYLRLDIQYFSEDGDGEIEYGSVQSSSEESIVQGYYDPNSEIQYPAIENPLLSSDEVQDQFEQPEEYEEVPEGQYEEVQGQEQQPDPRDAYIQQLMMQNRQMMALMQNQQPMQQQVQPPFQQPMQQQFQQPMQPQEPELSPEELNEKMMEEFYENPSQFFKKIQQQAIDEARRDLTPIIQERKITSEVERITQKYGDDFVNTIPEIQTLAVELGDEGVERFGLENVYLMAKGRMAMNQPYQQQAQQQQTLTAEEIFQNTDFVNHLAQNPLVQQAAMQQYLAGKQQQQPPRVMSNQAGSTPTFAPETRPKSISEATKLAARYFNV